MVIVWFYLTIRIWAQSFYRLIERRGQSPSHSIDWRLKLRASILTVLVEISEEEIKEQQYFFDKQLLNLFKQPMLMASEDTAATIRRVKLSNLYFKLFFIFFSFSYLWDFLGIFSCYFSFLWDCFLKKSVYFLSRNAFWKAGKGRHIKLLVFIPQTLSITW